MVFCIYQFYFNLGNWIHYDKNEVIILPDFIVLLLQGGIKWTI